MRLVIGLFVLAMTGCGSGAFSSKTETENRPRRAVEDGRLSAADDAGNLNTADAEEGDGGGTTKDGTQTPGQMCPQYDQATIDKLIASGQPFEVECEFEIEVGQDD